MRTSSRKCARGSNNGARSASSDIAAAQIGLPPRKRRAHRGVRQSHRLRRGRDARRCRRARKAAACCAPNSCSSNATPRPMKKNNGAATSRWRRSSGPGPLVIRTLDIGGDKPIPYLPLPPEDNPALGLRGVRTSLWRPDLLAVQLRALLRGAARRAGAHPAADDHGRRRDPHRAAHARRSAQFASGAPPAARRHGRNAGRGRARRPSSRAKSISCRSAPTISRSTRWPWIAATPNSRRASMACIRRSCGIIDATCKGAAVHRMPGRRVRGSRRRSGGGAGAAGSRRERVVGGAHADSAAQGADPRPDARCLPRARAARADARDGGAGARAGTRGNR